MPQEVDPATMYYKQCPFYVVCKSLFGYQATSSMWLSIPVKCVQEVVKPPTVMFVYACVCIIKCAAVVQA